MGMGCKRRIDRALKNALQLPLNACSRYVIMSDCHRGEGTMNDNFLKNQNLYYAALNCYRERGFFYVELGDGEELWENRSVSRIRSCHEDVYCLFLELEREGRIVRLYGNHDMELAKTLPEAVILKNREGGHDVAMLHGHQADFFNCVCWRLARFLVRYLWRPLERFGVLDPTSAARNYRKAARHEHCLAHWASQYEMYLVAGHSHRPRLLAGAEGERFYLNTGSCVHPGGIIALELENMEFTLVKWRFATREDMSLYVRREILFGPAAVE